MPRNWDQYQNINFVTQQVEWPRGPMTFEDLDPDLEPVWVEAWVLQGTTNASQRTAQWTGWAQGIWTADGIPPGWKIGNFQTGPAKGIALLAMRNPQTGAVDYDWWVDPIVLY
jgi:hypothetical protein